MHAAIAAPRQEMTPRAAHRHHPHRSEDPRRGRQGGATIRSIIDKTGVKVVSGRRTGERRVRGRNAAAKAIAMIRNSPRPRAQQSYLGRVERITDFGVIEIMPGVDGLLTSRNRQLPGQDVRRAQRRRADHGEGHQRRPVRQGRLSRKARWPRRGTTPRSMERPAGDGQGDGGGREGGLTVGRGTATRDHADSSPAGF